MLAGSAAAEPIAVRAAGGVGAMNETTWAAPEVDLVATFAIRSGFAQLAVGYSSIDNHTFLADGRSIRAAIAGGTQLGPVRAALVFELAFVAYHADPDVLAEHPGVDILVRRGGFLPSAGFELAYPIGASTRIGVFARFGLRELTLFDTPTGDRGRARLVLAGPFLELAIR
ncbi:MAG: hypothetical protein ABI867_01890 [Kofleriaceae bacterium]